MMGDAAISPHLARRCVALSHEQRQALPPHRPRNLRLGKIDRGRPRTDSP